MTNPGQAYFNICAIEYNDSLTTLDPVKACDKAIASDPTIADAYFIKGSILVEQGHDGRQRQAELSRRAPPRRCKNICNWRPMAITRRTCATC